MKKYIKGFTLIELLVVIAIIGILSSVVLVSLNTARKKGQDARVQTGVAQLRTQLEADFSNGVYPIKCGASVTSCEVTSDDGTGLGLAAVGNFGVIISDIFDQNAEGVVVTMSSNSTAGASPANGYALYARLPSNTAQYFCIASDGSTKTDSTGAPGTVTAANAVTCN